MVRGDLSPNLPDLVAVKVGDGRKPLKKADLLGRASAVANDQARLHGWIV
jgi:hypothetical protein